MPIKAQVCLDPFTQGWLGGWGFDTFLSLSLSLSIYNLLLYFMLTLEIISNNITIGELCYIFFKDGGINNEQHDTSFIDLTMVKV